MYLTDKIAGNLAGLIRLPAEKSVLFDPKWPTIEPWTTEELVIDDTFYYYDGPMFFSVKSGPFILLFMKWSEDDDMNLHTVTLVDQGVVDAMISGTLSVYGAVTHDMRFMVDMDGMQLRKVWKCSKWNISDKRLSNRGAVLREYKAVAPDGGVFADVVDSHEAVGFMRSEEADALVSAKSVTISDPDFRLTFGALSSSILGLARFVSSLAGPFRRVRHLAAQSVYEVVVEEVTIKTDTPIVEGDKVVVYQAGDGSMWGRLRSEMEDGRFETVQGEGGPRP